MKTIRVYDAFYEVVTKLTVAQKSRPIDIHPLYISIHKKLNKSLHDF